MPAQSQWTCRSLGFARELRGRWRDQLRQEELCSHHPCGSKGMRLLDRIEKNQICPPLQLSGDPRYSSKLDFRIQSPSAWRSVRRQLLFPVDDNYFSLRTTSTAISC